MKPLETITFWHPTEGGGVRVASSCVGPAPLDVPVVLAGVLQRTGFQPAIGMNRSTLTFSAPANSDPVDGVARVTGAYRACACCHLCASRMQVVHQRGNAHAVVAFLGEGPGKDEDDLGEPFVGRSGKLQDEMMRQVGIDPVQHLFWMNVLGCRAGERWGEDRPPTDAELVACSEHAYLLLQAVRPRVVVCLGKVATRYFFDAPPPVWSFTRFVPEGAPDDWIMVGYAHHPAYLVRCVAAPSMYKEYAAQRSFYTMLAQRMSGVSKVSRWLFLPRYLSLVTNTPLVGWPGGGNAVPNEDVVE